MIPKQIDLPTGESLRPLRQADARAVFETVDADREHLGRWLIWVERTHEQEDSRVFLAMVESKMEAGETYAFGIWRGDELLGICGLHDISRVNSNAQIGYWLRSSATGQGTMSRAVRALLGFGFETLDLERIEIRAAVDNEASWKIAERLGFQFEAVMRRLIRIPAGFADARLYSLLRDEWLAQPSRSSAP